tara:strand:- start:555 stop:686 length:132 start_codon:yes stop_codon:yes gene_type:complete
VRRSGKLIGLGVVGTAAGNFLWGAAFGSNEDTDEGDREGEDEE